MIQKKEWCQFFCLSTVSHFYTLLTITVFSSLPKVNLILNKRRLPDVDCTVKLSLKLHSIIFTNIKLQITEKSLLITLFIFNKGAKVTNYNLFVELI